MLPFVQAAVRRDDQEAHLVLPDQRMGSAPPRRGDIPPFAAVRAFDAIGRLGGIRRAAEELMLDHAVVSRHLRSLEAWTGTVLVTRERGRVTLTEAGRRYHQSLSQAIDMMAEATRALRPSSETAQLRVWCTPGLASKWLLPRMGVLGAWPDAGVIDVRPSDRPPDFNRQEADIDLRYAPTYGQALALPANVRSLVLAEPEVVPVAAPAYLAARPPIVTAADLLSHSLLHEEDTENWRAWFAAHGITTHLLPGIRLWHAHLTTDAAAQGNGIALANRFLAGSELAAGRLVEVEGADGPFARATLGSYLFVARTDCWSMPQVGSFRRWLVDAVAAA